MTEHITLIEDDAPHILIVDDDRRIRSLLSKFLSDHGFRVSTAETAAAARDHRKALVFDLIVLDVMMPGENGVEFAKSLRTDNDTIPILMLTARSESEHRITGLEAGADDYLPKPFEPRELLLRINNILRRAVAQDAGPVVPDAIRIGPLVFHRARGELQRDGETIRLTERERELLKIFSDDPGGTVSRHELVDDGSAGSERAVDVQINRLRRKIENDPANPTHLQTVRGVGYKLVVDPW
ncbi:MAG: response regulator transcription factor [Pseudomonadota bacterium]